MMNCTPRCFGRIVSSVYGAKKLFASDQTPNSIEVGKIVMLLYILILTVQLRAPMRVKHLQRVHWRIHGTRVSTIISIHEKELTTILLLRILDFGHFNDRTSDVLPSQQKKLHF